MKRFSLFILVGILGGLFSLTIQGTEGGIMVPSPGVSWGRGNLGIEVGAHYISYKDAYGENSLTPKATLTLFGKWEIGGTYDMQKRDRDDLFFHSKLRFYPWEGEGTSQLGIGVIHYQLKPGSLQATQVYLSASYRGRFLGMPAETFFTFGKTFADFVGKGDLDAGISFVVAPFPSVFKGYLLWINEISNFKYSPHGVGVYLYRGVYNTGLRVLPLKKLGGVKMSIDILLLDALDNNRPFAVGGSLGVVF